MAGQIPASFRRRNAHLPPAALQQKWWAVQDPEDRSNSMPADQSVDTAPATSTPAPSRSIGPISMAGPRIPLHFDQSEQVGDLVTALAAAQCEYKPIPSNNTAEVRKEGKLKYTYKYASLGDVLSATRPALAKHGVALLFAPSINLNTMAVTASIRKGEQWISVVAGGPWTTNNGNSLQGIGGGLTYLRRYAVQCLLGVAPDEDLDGQEPEKAAEPEPRRAPKPTRAAPKPSDVPVGAEARQEWFLGELDYLKLRRNPGVGPWMKSQGLRLSDMAPEKVVEALHFFSSDAGKAALDEAAQGAGTSR